MHDRVPEVEQERKTGGEREMGVAKCSCGMAQ
jgi:hypothetical protein